MIPESWNRVNPLELRQSVQGINMMRLNFLDEERIGDQLRYRCSYHYKTHCRYIVALLALTAVVAVLSACLALRTAPSTAQQQQEEKEAAARGREPGPMTKEAADPGPGPGRSIISVSVIFKFPRYFFHE